MRLSQQDFLRRMPEASDHLRSPRSLWQIIHVDPWLLALLLALTAYGLVVLYSAGGDNLALIKRQGLFLLAGYISMFMVAQVNVNVFFHWTIMSFNMCIKVITSMWFLW